MTREQVVARIATLVRSEYRIEVKDPSADMLETLGLDSLDLTEMVFSVEEIFNIDIPTNELYGCRTLNDVAGIVLKKLGDGAESGETGQAGANV